MLLNIYVRNTELQLLKYVWYCTFLNESKLFTFIQKIYSTKKSFVSCYWNLLQTIKTSICLVSLKLMITIPQECSGFLVPEPVTDLIESRYVFFRLLLYSAVVPTTNLSGTAPLNVNGTRIWVTMNCGDLLMKTKTSIPPNYFQISFVYLPASLRYIDLSSFGAHFLRMKLVLLPNALFWTVYISVQIGIFTSKRRKLRP